MIDQDEIDGLVQKALDDDEQAWSLLLQEVRSGNTKVVDALQVAVREGWPEIASKLGPKAWKICYAMLGNQQDAEDAFQETFEKAQKKLSQYVVKCPVADWILQICRNTCRDKRRWRQHRRYDESLDETPSAREEREGSHVEMITADTEFEEKQITQLDFERALDKLSDDEREAFVLIKVAGYKSDEAGRIAGEKPSTMRDRLARARAKLAIGLEDYTCG